MIRLIFVTLLTLLVGGEEIFAKPRLVVQIVVSSMRSEDIERYNKNFGDGGFRYLTQRGAYCTQSHYGFAQTTTPVTLTTLATGAMPSTHGVVGKGWVDYTSNAYQHLTVGDMGFGGYNLIAPTLSDALLSYSPNSQAVTVALDPISAITMAGRSGDVYWLNEEHTTWQSSPYYARLLPQWVAQRNRERYNTSLLFNSGWRRLLPEEEYINERAFDISSIKRGRSVLTAERRLRHGSDYERFKYTPAGNSITIDFAIQAISNYDLGRDDEPDLLNIVFDSSRYITELYGPESVEVEDMYYRLDRDIATLLTFIGARFEPNEVIVVLTSAHGTSPSYDAGREELDRLNIRQTEVIVNGFLNVKYGTGDWVLRYEDRNLWLNHNLIYEKGLSLEEVQNEVAMFMMQFRGVSHALSATAMRNNYFGAGYAQKMQNGFFPKRSGDVVLNLMPGWIESREGVYSSSGSMYGYDTNVPLIIYGGDIASQLIEREVDMVTVAPSVARILGITAPTAAEGGVLTEIID